MSDRQLDVVFVHPGNTKSVYQALRGKHSAVETPTWTLLLSQSCRAAGFGVALVDCDAEELTDRQFAARIALLNPRLVVMVAMGSEPNQSTVRMGGCLAACRELKWCFPQYKTCLVGNHVSALPLEVLNDWAVDFVLLNEGVIALRNLLATDLETDLGNVKGIGWKDNGLPRLNDPEQVVPQTLMDSFLPGYAWDLLPSWRSLADMYRSHFWHGQYHHDKRTPFAALYTSLGCRWKCAFCMINILNRVNNDTSVTAADSPVMRWWSAEQTLRQFDYLVQNGVTTIRISDEMFFLDKRHFEPIIDGLIERGYGDKLNLWAYARVDTVRPKYLEKFRKAGIRWLCVGIEAGNQKVRQEVTKGSFEEVDIRQVVRDIENSG